jgi:hypothetical protein
MNLRDKLQVNKQSNILSFLTPSIAGIVLVSVFLSQTFTAAQGLLKDCDTGYHIRAGEYILNNLSIPKSDIFSFHSPPLPWIAHEWLSEVIMAAIHRISGLTGIVIFFSILISIVYYLLFKILQSLKSNIIVASFVIMLVIASSQMHWLARPHIFSMLLILVWYYLLDAYQYNNQRNFLYLQIPLMLLWVNIHGGFITGFILNGIYLLGNIVELISSTESERNVYRRKAIILGLTIITCFFISLINPYGYQILIFPFKLVKEKFILDNISEFLSPNFHSLWAIPFELFLFITLAVFSFTKKRLNLIELVLIIFFLHMSLVSARYIPLFCIIAAPIVVKQAEQMLEHSKGKISNFLMRKSDSFSEIDASASDFVWPAVAFLIVILLAFSSQIKHDFDLNKKPIEAAKFIEQEHIKGNMFNMDEFGDYIIYRNYPKYRVFIDGRIDMYGSKKFKEYIEVVNFEQGWGEILEKYQITWIIYYSKSALSRYLLQNEDWSLVYADKVASIFLKKIPGNQRLIQKYRNVKPFIDEPG